MRYRLDDGNIILADEAFMADQYPAGTYEVLPDEPPPVIRKTVLTKLEAMERFTDAELAAIYTAAKSVVAVEVWLEKFKAAPEVNLNDPRTILGIQSLVTAGIFTEERATEILTP